MVAIAIMCICFGFDTMAQDDRFFIKKINRERFRGAAITESNNDIYISSLGICTDKECSIVMKVDTLGDIIWERQLDWLDGTFNNIIVESDTLVVSGNDNQDQTRWFIHKMDINTGDSLSTVEIVDPQQRFRVMFNLGMISWNDHYVLNGFVKTETENMVGLFMINKHSETLDTVLTLYPTSTGFLSSPTFCQVDPDNNLVLFTAYDRSGGERSDIITKIDGDYNTLWQYQTVEDDTQTFPYGGILSDGRIVFHTSNQTFDSRIGSTLCLDKNGEEVWHQFLPATLDKIRLVNNMFIDSNDNILKAGNFGELVDDYAVFGPWLSNRNDSGEEVWSRVYYQEDPNWDIASLSGSFLDLVRLQDGSIMAVGRMNNAFTEGRSILLARLDSVGWLTPNCPEINNITEILTSNQDIHISNADLGIQLFPNPVHDVLHLRSDQDISHVQIIDIHGAVVLSEQQAKQIQLSRLPSGIYFARCSTEKGEATLKFMKE